MAKQNQRVALLATGDEVINGDIVNSNGQAIANILVEANIIVGNHLVATDEQSDIEYCLEFLLSQHEAVISIGGLGPTSDDRTRYAISKVSQTALKFDDQSWHNIIERLESLGLTVPESNKQQAMFSQGAEILGNHNGTAAGCYLQYNNKHLFMLPGPPRECLPMMQQQVLPILQKLNFAKPIQRRSWLLLGISEGHIASELDKIIQQHPDVTLGYRASSPYLEIKLHATNTEALKKAEREILPLIKTNLISNNKQKASSQLYDYIQQENKSIHITDKISGGLLESILLTPEVYSKLAFHDSTALNQADICIELDGLYAYWDQNSQQTKSTLSLSIQSKGKSQRIEKQLPYRSKYLRGFAAELACWELLQWFIKKA